jgi:hypothetical protein
VSINTSLQQNKYRDSSAYKGTGEHLEFFTGVVGDPEAIHNLFDFKNYVIKTMLLSITVTQQCWQVHLYIHKYTYIFHDSLT